MITWHEVWEHWNWASDLILVAFFGVWIWLFFRSKPGP